MGVLTYIVVEPVERGLMHTQGSKGAALSLGIQSQSTCDAADF